MRDIIMTFHRLNGYSSKTTTEFVHAVAAIPRHVTYLDLSANGLESRSGEDLVRIITAIPANVTTLNLSKNGLSSKSSRKLALAFAGIPSNVTHLILMTNEFGNKSGQELALIFSAIPATVRTLDLANNSLGSKSGLELAQVLVKIKATSLSLRRNYLFKKSGGELKTVFEGFINVTSIDLSENHLGILHAIELTEAIKVLLDHVTCVDLSDNDLSKKTSEELVRIFGAFHARVFFLNLSKNNLGEKPQQELLQIFKILSTKVKTLDLSENKLFVQRSITVKDNLLNSLNNKFEKLQLRKNGESNFARALLPMLSFAKQNVLPMDLVFRILSFLIPSPNTQIDLSTHVKRTIESFLSPELLKLSYRKYSGLSEVSIFNNSSKRVVAVLKERASNAQESDDAALQVLKRYGLNS